MFEFRLPDEIADLVAARNRLRRRFASSGLKFTLDGNLVGDIGEALAAEIFGIRLTEARSFEGIDGYAPDDRSVQVKATVTNRGPAFRMVETHADHLLFFTLDVDNLLARVVYNGPEEIVRRLLPPQWVGQRCVSRSRLAVADKMVDDGDRLKPLSAQRR